MVVELFDVINDPFPKLRSLRKFNADLREFQYDDRIVNFFNKNLLMDKLSAEHIYALSYSYSLSPKGILQVGIGKSDRCEANMKMLASGLLLTGAEQFMCFHNHPGGNKEITYDDCVMTNKYKELGDLLDIDFLKHIMITQGYYTICNMVEEDNYVFGTEV